MKGELEGEEGLEELVSDVIGIEESEEYSAGKKIIGRRNGIRKVVKEKLASKIEIRPEANVFAGFVKQRKGRIRWKDVAAEYAKAGKIDAGRQDEIIKRNTSQAGRVYYGYKADLSEPKYEQLEFSFLTPERKG